MSEVLSAIRIISAASPCIGVAGNQEAGVGIAFQKPGQPVKRFSEAAVSTSLSNSK